MKAIQVTFDEELLAELDASEEVRREGRSAVLRKATAEYLARRRRSEISESYARAYGEEPGLGEEFAGWGDEGRWPEK
jgi:metal-responsive CopG/Arc/MetJ family transcriptional regulator